MQVTVRFLLVSTPILRGDTLGEVRILPPLSPSPTSRGNLHLDGYLEYPHAAMHYAFTSIHAFSRTRTQTLRHGRQHH
ncbi:hypothetical protein TNCV_1250181 [Trichonephila clavipes]|nr:hypothetical protein TNCV_1250181 [Trichonephila clavipes]